MMNPNHPPTLLIATDSDRPGFNTTPWEQEGYNVKHLPDVKSRREIDDATDFIESDERYAILAYGKAATHALNFAISGERALLATIAYYPPTLPSLKYHPGIHILVHLPASSNFSLPENVSTKVFVYPDVEPGFAEPNSRWHDRIATGLAFSRSLGLLRRTIGPRLDLEAAREALWQAEVTGDINGALDSLVTNPYITTFPSSTGGAGYTELQKFYQETYILNSPPSLKFKLISRTVGTNRVVDEVITSFRHTKEIPWMLPGVLPTDKECEVGMVFIVCMRGTRIAAEHIYWDQASVLLQLGLINGEGLPVVGAESTRRLQDGKT